MGFVEDDKAFNDLGPVGPVVPDSRRARGQCVGLCAVKRAVTQPWVAQ